MSSEKREQDLETLKILGYEDEETTTEIYDSFNGDFNRTLNKLLEKSSNTKPETGNTSVSNFFEEKEDSLINNTKTETENTSVSDFFEEKELTINKPTENIYQRKTFTDKRKKLGTDKEKRIEQRLKLLEECKFVVDQIVMTMLRQDINYSEIVSYLMSNKHLNVRFNISKK